MGLKKGMINNPKGRTPGVPNKTTADFRLIINNIISANLDQVPSDIKALEPYQRLQFFEKMLSYLLPKPQSEVLKVDSERESKASAWLEMNELMNNYHFKSPVKK